LKKKNLYDDANYSERIEEFLDNLMDAGIFSLTVGRSIESYGVGMVNIKCMSDKTGKSKDGDYREVSFHIAFQADPSPEVTFKYMVDDEMENVGLLEVYYSDSDGNSSPEDNDYFAEFVDDLRPVG